MFQHLFDNAWNMIVDCEQKINFHCFKWSHIRASNALSPYVLKIMYPCSALNLHLLKNDLECIRNWNIFKLFFGWDNLGKYRDKKLNLEEQWIDTLHLNAGLYSSKENISWIASIPRCSHNSPASVTNNKNIFCNVKLFFESPSWANWLQINRR